jgi:glycosyltransferase involved in cell wall biosynthesis
MSTLSVVIPAYNREAYLGEAIASVLAQTYPVDEIIVVDDGSTDRTAAIARSYGQPVRCISQENQGTGAARNTGLNAARGSLIALLDSDDLWLERKLERQAAYLQANPGTDLVFCQMRPFVSPEIDPAQASKFDLREIAACNAQALLARREAFARAGAFPTARDLPEFFPWFERACDLGLTHHILPEVLLLRRIHLGNAVHHPEWRSRYLRFLKTRLDRRRGPAKSAE